MTIYKMNLSTTEPNNYIGMVKVRQYDTESQTFDVTVTENGVPVDFTGLTPLFYVRGNPNTSNWISEQKVTDIVDAKNGRLRYTLSHYDMQNLGKNKGYFAFLDLKEDGDIKEKFERTFQYSTKDFTFYVLKSAFSDGIHDSNYIWTFEEMLRYFMEWIEESQNTYDGWYEEAKAELERIITEFNSWIVANQDIYDDWISNQKSDFMDWLQGNKGDFTDWFESIRDILDEDAAGNLQNQFDKINPDVEIIELVHDLKSYPKVRALYWEYGLATVPLGYEPTGIGGDNVITINSAIEYLDRGSMKVKVPRYYKLVNPEVIVLKNAVRLISDHRVLQIEFDRDVTISAPIKEVTITLDMKDKVAGSVVENPHSLSWVTQPTELLLPDSANWGAGTQTHYDLIASLDDNLLSVVRIQANVINQMMFKYNIIEALERYDSNYFSDRGATTLPEKVAVAKNEIISFASNTHGYGSGASGNLLTTKCFVPVSVNNWENESSMNDTDTIKNVTRTYTNAYVRNRIDDQGFVYIIAYAPASDGTTASSVSIDYTSLDITFLGKKWY